MRLVAARLKPGPGKERFPKERSNNDQFVKELFSKNG